jgi:hypothetical protein
MKCEKCPYYGLEGVKNNMDWCKLYSAKAPVDGCEAERDAFIKQQEMMKPFYDSKKE